MATAQDDFLKSYIPLYVSCQSTGGFQDFWTTIGREYHAKYPIVLTADDVAAADGDRELAFQRRTDKDLKYIRGFFANGTRTGIVGKGGGQLILQICRASSKPEKKRTRKPLPWQTYAKYIDFRNNLALKAEFATEYAAHCGALPAGAAKPRELTVLGRWLTQRLELETEEVKSHVEELRHAKGSEVDEDVNMTEDNGTLQSNEETPPQRNKEDPPPDPISDPDQYQRLCDSIPKVLMTVLDSLTVETKWSFCVFACGPEPKFNTVPRSYSYANGGTSTLPHMFNAKKDVWRAFQQEWDRWGAERYPNGWSGISDAIDKLVETGMTRDEAIASLEIIPKETDPEPGPKKGRRRRRIAAPSEDVTAGPATDDPLDAGGAATAPDRPRPRPIGGGRSQSTGSTMPTLHNRPLGMNEVQPDVNTPSPVGGPAQNATPPPRAPSEQPDAYDRGLDANTPPPVDGPPPEATPPPRALSEQPSVNNARPDADTPPLVDGLTPPPHAPSEQLGANNTPPPVDGPPPDPTPPPCAPSQQPSVNNAQPDADTPPPVDGPPPEATPPPRAPREQLGANNAPPPVDGPPADPTPPPRAPSEQPSAKNVQPDSDTPPPVDGPPPEATPPPHAPSNQLGANNAPPPVDGPPPDVTPPTRAAGAELDALSAPTEQDAGSAAAYLPTWQSWVLGADESWRSVLSDIQADDLQDCLNPLLDSWVAFEASRGYIDGNRNMKTAFRPAQVLWWMNSLRDPDAIPDINDFDVFVTNWWKWLHVLSPVWRQHPNFESPFPPFTHDIPEAAEWGYLTQSGSKGMVLVVATVVWWGTAVALQPGDRTSGWLAAIQELTWVLQNAAPLSSRTPLTRPLASADSANKKSAVSRPRVPAKRGLKRKANENAEPKPSKRTRRK
ncbi:hypothetical protein PUNSTDRAFT_130402 [Punctularia strigosozonata HHB-11173 SS5]|uniref:uncharacterized protein n=1 Tax=Punctularia strigosozonata (strain HHB-11173) TaxID=741275 RepID=UPI0004416855|nr:uncharacterized protein PUNSTDRAFT_130402 [Punctularia strigosozonata HHB-11173 SS5]EIN12131.1 hypothetical protein PUNSTDRAFT_130402 [Punctularia strigosozonata HHB-11173 SS5]